MMALLQSVPRLPLGGWVDAFVGFVDNNFSWFFDALRAFLEALVGGLEAALTTLPALVMVVIFAGLAWLIANWRVAILTALGFLLILSLDLWEPSMLTLALVISSALAALVLGIPLGIAGAKSRIVRVVITPILDFMQTLPAYVYLLPSILLLGIGSAPAVIAVVVFAMPPAVRLTMLGIQQVSKETVEAANAFGSTGWQTLLKVELPLSLPTIKAGVNQVIMLSLSMVVIAALIGAGGLGSEVYEGLSRLEIGQAAEGGVAIVAIAVILDRITRNIGTGDSSGSDGKGMKTA